MSGQRHHPHVTDAAFTPQRPRPGSPIPIDIDEQSEVDSHIFFSPNPQITLRDIDIHNGIRREPSPTALLQFNLPPPAPQQHLPTMELTEERFRQLQALAEQQAKQIEDGYKPANFNEW